MPNYGFWEILAISIMIVTLTGMVYAMYYIATLIDRLGLLKGPDK